MVALSGAPARFRGSKGRGLEAEDANLGPKGQVYSIHGHAWYLCQPRGDLRG